MTDKRLFIITNLLPVHVDEKGKGKPANTGFASAIQSYLQKGKVTGNIGIKECYWAGIAGNSAESWMRVSYSMPASNYEFIPVFVNDKMYHLYHSFSNRVIWPTFHYFPSYVNYDSDTYRNYVSVNELFLETLLKYVRVNDIIWINDYHLLPLAAMLRNALPGISIALFLHTPFPSHEVLRILPRKCQEELISGMLGADLIGFNTIDYAAHFLDTLRMVYALHHDMHIVRYNNRLIKTDVFPFSVNFEKFKSAFDREEVRELRQSMKYSLGNKQIILSISKLDFTKGIYNRLKAYEYFLTRNLSFHNKVVFILVIVPKGDDKVDYMRRKNKIDEAISNINSKIGNITWQPIIFHYTSLSFNTALSLYTSCDLALITPLREGMNLICKEFVASRKDKRGVLVLSELAGAARELTGALLANPNDIEEIGERIKEGLEMKENEQVERMEMMQKRLAAYDVSAWACDFMNQLSDIKNKQTKFQVKFFDEFTRRAIFHEYQLSRKRLLILDYDGTLVPFAMKPSEAKPGKELLKTLERLSSENKNDIFLISGRTSDWMDEQFSRLPVSMIAENGGKVKWKGSEWVSEREPAVNWKKEVENIMQDYVRRCPDTFIEVKDFSVVWHYRMAIAAQGELRALELFSHLNEAIQFPDIHVVMGNQTVEVRTQGIALDISLRKILSQASYDFILAIGDDEDMFNMLAEQNHSFSIKIGEQASFAKYNLLTQQMAISFIEYISMLTKPVHL